MNQKQTPTGVAGQVSVGGQAVPADNIRLATIAIVVAVLALSFGDAVVKLVSAEFSLWQLYVLRSLFALPPLILLIIFAKPAGSFRLKTPGWTAFRSLLLVVMWAVYYAALPHIPFSVAASVYYTIPLFITLFSALFTGEKVGVKSWLAVAFGFAGVLVIVRPAAENFNGYALLPLLSAILFAYAMILTRTKCRHESPKNLALAQNAMFIVVGGVASVALALWRPPELAAANPFLFGEWTALGVIQWLTLATLAATVVVGNLCGAFAYQNGPPPTIATFDYTYLIFSLIWGFLLFTEIPDLPSLVGMLMIAAAGIIVVRQR